MDSIEIIEDIKDKDIPVTKIDDFGTDYVLRCTRGVYTGMFAYLSVTEFGEIIGSGQDCTLLIDDCGLQAKHAIIKWEYDDELQKNAYHLKSYSPTWVKIRYDVPTVIRDNMEIKIGKKVYLLKFDSNNFDDLYEWLNRHEIRDIKHVFEIESMNVKANLKYLRSLQPQKIQNLFQKFNISDSVSKKFFEAYPSLKDQFEEKQYQSSKIQVYDKSQQLKQILLFSWSGATISSKTWVYEKPPDILLKRSDFEDYDDNVDFELNIRFFYGKYIIQSSKLDSYNVFYRLNNDEIHSLNADDVLRIQDIELTVQRYNCGYHSDIGTRPTMEDSYAIIQDLQTGKIPISCFAIFDGHKGDQCVKFVSYNLLDNLRETINSSDFETQTKFFQFIVKKIKEAFKKTDNDFYTDYKDDKAILSGCVCALILIVGDFLISANCGDCRSILSKSGKAITLSVDHKPDNPKELDRIQRKGGQVQGSRIEKLAVSRAFGDFNLKKQKHMSQKNIVSCIPDVKIQHIDYKTDEFVVICSDGIIDGFKSSQNVVDFIREDYMKNQIGQQDPQTAARNVVLQAYDLCFKPKQQSDNLSCIVVNLSRGIH